MNKIVAAIAWLMIWVVSLSTAQAHTRSESYSHWYPSGSEITGVITIPLREVMVLYGAGDAATAPAELFQRHLQETISVHSSTNSCPSGNSAVLQSASGCITVELQFSCAAKPPDRIRFRAIFAATPAHVHYAKVHLDGLLISEALITASADSFSIVRDGANDALPFAGFVGVGVKHIGGGVDHIAFLLGLLLIAGSTGRCIIAVTGFTLGHSASLAAAVLGFVRADGRLVEAFIGFTIMLVAAEYFALRQQRPGGIATGTMLLAWLAGLIAFAFGKLNLTALIAYAGCGVFAWNYLRIAAHTSKHEEKRASVNLLLAATACFGLIHGFGFAGFLMDTGLLGRDLLLPLLGFNLGVELGQLGIVAVALLAVRFLRRQMPGYLPQLVAASLCGIGIFWFVGRSLQA